MPVLPLDIETDGPVYHVVSDPQDQTESVSEIVTETESFESARTLDSDQVQEYFVRYQGQLQPVFENAMRWCPLDGARRYIIRHMLRKWLFGYNYLSPVRELFNSGPAVGKRHRALQVGTRDGTWIQEMATEFPHVQFTSVDIVPIAPHTPRANIEFEVYDVTEGLLLDANSQDVVFIEVGIELVKDYRILIQEAYRVLRPGGLIHIHDYAPGFWDSQDISQPARRTNPIACRLSDLLRDVATGTGGDLDAMAKIFSWMAPGSGLWGADQTKGFELLRTTITPFPYYPHSNYPCSSTLSPNATSLMVHFVPSLMWDHHTLLRDAGLSDEEAKSLIEATIEELKDPERCPVSKVYDICATKKI